MSAVLFHSVDMALFYGCDVLQDTKGNTGRIGRMGLPYAMVLSELLCVPAFYCVSMPREMPWQRPWMFPMITFPEKK